MVSPETKVVFIARNVHVASSGDPPGIANSDPGRFYYGYFETTSEQWVLVYDHKTGRGTLWGGDAGWDQEFSVVNGRVSGVILGSDEIAWLKACWAAATGETPAIVSPITELVAGLATKKKPEGSESGPGPGSDSKSP